MTDTADDAQRVEAFLTAAAIGRARGPRRECVAVDPNCAGCGEPIDPERREAQPRATRCLECQSAVERSDRLFLRKLL